MPSLPARCGATTDGGDGGPCILPPGHDESLHEDRNGSCWLVDVTPESTPRTALRDRIAEALRTVGLARNLAAYRDAVLPVVEEALAEQRTRLRAVPEEHRCESVHPDRDLRCTRASDHVAHVNGGNGWSCACDLTTEHAEKAERQRDQAIAALTHHAAEAHRRKWAHDDRGDVLAFRALGNLGDEILASRDRILAALDADQPKETP